MTTHEGVHNANDGQESALVSAQSTEDSFVECCMVPLPKCASSGEPSFLVKCCQAGSAVLKRQLEAHMIVAKPPNIIVKSQTLLPDENQSRGDISPCRLKSIEKQETPSSSEPETMEEDILNEKAGLLFIEKVLGLANEATSKSQNILADKLICGIFKKLDEIYAPEQIRSSEYHPLLGIESCPLVAQYPDTIKAPLIEASQQVKYTHNLAQKIFVTNILDRFNVTHLKGSIDSTQPLVQGIWSSCLDIVTFKPLAPPLAFHAIEAESAVDADTVVEEDDDLDDDYEHAGEGQRDDADETTTAHPQVNFVDSQSPGTIPSSKNTGVNTRMVIRTFSRSKSTADSKRNNTGNSSSNGDSVSLTHPSPRVFSVKSRQHGRKSKYTQFTSKIFITRRTTFLRQHFKRVKIKTGDGWVKDSNKALDTFYRYEPNGSVSIKLRSKLPCNLLHVLYIINETELSTRWVPFLKQAHDVYHLTRTCKIFQQYYDYPVVGTKATAVFGVAVNALEEANCLIIACTGPPENQNDVQRLEEILKSGGIGDTGSIVSIDAKGKCKIFDYLVEPHPKRTRQRSADLCFLLFPHGEDYTVMELYANIMPEVKMVPLRVVSYIIKKVVLGMFKRIVSICRTFENSPLAKQAQGNQMYIWMKQIYDDYRIKNAKPKCNISISTYYPSNTEI